MEGEESDFEEWSAPLHPEVYLHCQAMKLSFLKTARTLRALIQTGHRRPGPVRVRRRRQDRKGERVGRAGRRVGQGIQVDARYRPDMNTYISLVLEILST